MAKTKFPAVHSKKNPRSFAEPYAEVCGLPELGEANYKAMLAQEKANNEWSREQVLLIEALHLFATSYFSGRTKITQEVEPEAGDGSSTVSKGGTESQSETEEVAVPAPPQCPPEQKQKVENAIKAYVQSAQAN